MKTFFVSLLVATVALSQDAFITSPITGQSLTAGESFVINVKKPLNIQFTDDIGIALELATCLDTTCETAGPPDVLYIGAFDPQFVGTQDPNENFTVSVRDNFSPGPAALTLIHAFLEGADLGPVVEVNNVTVNILPPTSS